MGCELCERDGGAVLWRDGFCRVVQVASEDFPAFCRVILGRHVGEMTDLAASERERLMRAVFACEQALRDLVRPAKMNLASLGNQVAHLHWHVVARYADDSRFPDPIWAAPRRAGARRAAPDPQALRAALGALLA